jgi:hypothetical protein
MAVKNKVLKKTYNETAEAVDGLAARTAQFTFEESGSVLTVSFDTLPDNIKIQAALHGILQKAGDGAAGKQGDDAEEAVTSIVEQIMAGQWNATREAGEAAPSLIATAVFRWKESLGKLKEGETLEVVQARYAGKEGAKLRADAMKRTEVATIVQTIKIERAQAKLEALKAKGTTTAETDADNL